MTGLERNEKIKLSRKKKAHKKCCDVVSYYFFDFDFLPDPPEPPEPFGIIGPLPDPPEPPDPPDPPQPFPIVSHLFFD